MPLPTRIDRRSFLLAAGGLGVTGAIALGARAASRSAAAAVGPRVAASSSPVWQEQESEGSHPSGTVEPRRPAPAISLLAADGSALSLSTWLVGRPTAVQLMFTRCTSTCPIQGALFGAVAARLPPATRLLSISIDPEHDSPAALRTWLARYAGHPAWTAATPRTRAEADVILDFLRGRTDALDRHSLQVFMFDAKGQLTYRTADLPSVAHVSDVLRQLA